MDQKKINEGSEEASTSIKTTAVDTGRRIEINTPAPRSTVLRRPRDEGRQSHERRAKKAPEAPEKVVAEQERAEERIAPTHAPAETSNFLRPVENEPRVISYVEPTEFDDSGDFASMLEESEQSKNVSVRLGDKVTGKIIHIGKDHAFVSLDAKLEVAIATVELLDKDGQLKYHMGDTISAYVSSVTGGITISNNVAQSGMDEAMLHEAMAKRMPVEGKIIGQNKGGFDVQISGKRAFCPIGQIDIKFVEDGASFIGRSMAFLVERVEEGGRNIVVSRRALLERERRDQALETIRNLEVGKKYDAVITRVADFGAFADIGGLEGLIPRSEISHGRIERVSDAVASNDRVEVVVLSFELNEADPSKSRLSFSLKKAKEDPYALYWNKIQEGTTMEGRVVRLESFGAFVELFPGIDGLIHISELSENRIAHPKEILSVGDPVSVRILSVNNEEKRIGLSLREPVSKKKDLTIDATAKVERGQKASGTISRIERYGVFVELESGATALLPQSETGLPKNADLSRAFKIGDSIEVAVIDVDAQNRIRVSSLARQQMEERDSFLQFHHKENRASGFGTFADLFKKRD